MKKVIVYIMIAAVCLSLCACTKSCGRDSFIPGSAPAEVTPLPTTTPAPLPAATPAVTGEASAAPAIEGGFSPDLSTAPGGASANTEAAAMPAVTSAPVVAAPVEPTPVPTPVPAPAATPAPARVYATKSPTDEYIVEGGSAQFVARAENDTGITWFLATPDAGSCITIQEANRYFPYLSIQGYNSDCLTLSNIPLAMSGYKIQARYDGFGGPVHTNMATLWVVSLKEAMGSGYYNPGYHNPGSAIPGVTPGYSWAP